MKKLLKGNNSGKNQLSMTLIKYDHPQVMGTITGKFYQNPLKTVRGVGETRLCLRTDEPKTVVPFNLHWGTKITQNFNAIVVYGRTNDQECYSV